VWTQIRFDGFPIDDTLFHLRIRSMNILIVVPSYYPAFVYGGPIFSIHYAAQGLARQGTQVRVSTTNANGSSKLDVPTAEPVLFEPNYSVRYYDDTIIGRFSWAFTRNLWRDIRAAEIVHLQCLFSAHGAGTLLVASLQRKPLLITARGVLTPWGLANKRPWLKKAWLAMLVRPFIRDSRRVAWHATSAVERDEILAVFPQAKVHVIPNAIDCAAFEAVPELAREVYLERFFPGRCVDSRRVAILAAMGRLHPKKAFDIAIRAVRKVIAVRPKVLLLIAGGDDGERAPLMQLIDKLDLRHCVALIGELKGEDKIAFLKGADLFLFPSHSENFGLACLEALASGLPVVASRRTPWAEVEEQGAGRWVENTPSAFGSAITELLTHDLESLSDAARRLARKYSLAAVANDFNAVYSELINTNG
jgi:glycosyltransferase involved in cell wall biosynthesis